MYLITWCAIIACRSCVMSNVGLVGLMAPHVGLVCSMTFSMGLMCPMGCRVIMMGPGAMISVSTMVSC